MNVKMGIVSIILVSIGASILCSSVRADDGGDRERRRAQLMLRQVQEQKTALEQEKDALTAQVEALSKEIASLKQRNQKLGQNKGVIEQESAATKKDLEICKQEASILQANLQSAQADNASLASDIKVAQQAFMEVSKQGQDTAARMIATEGRFKDAARAAQVCDRKNMQLYQYSLDLLKRYQDKGLIEVFLHKEPITQLDRVKVENLMQEYKGKLDQERVQALGN